MLYAIAHFLRDKMPWLWDLVDIINSVLFKLRFGGKLRAVEAEVLKRYEAESGMRIVPMSEVKTDDLVAFFAAQPEEAFTFFKPHGFDGKALKKLQKNKSFLAFVLIDDNNDSETSGTIGTSGTSRIAGYCFIRSFFMGKGFRGRMVGMSHRGRGLGTLMNRLMNDVGFGIGLRLFETVNKKNVASYRSAMSASNVKVLEEMEDDELYLEIINSKEK